MFQRVLNGCLSFFERKLTGAVQRSIFWSLLLAICLAGAPAAAQPSERIAPDVSHVPELARYLQQVQIHEAIDYRQLRVYPISLRNGANLPGTWLTMDQAIQRGDLVVTEKGTDGRVPVVVVENRSRRDHVFIMTGEMLSGGKQTRTVRKDVILAPGQRIEISVFCVEKRRWQGGPAFAASETLLPQSIQKALRGGADQQRIWDEVARSNKALGGENPTENLDRALKTKPIREGLAACRRHVVPQIPDDAVGFLFVSGRRPAGAEMFGSAELAHALFPKVLDAYAVDLVLRAKIADNAPAAADNVVIAFFQRIQRAGSRRNTTPGSGAGIQTRRHGLLGDGVSLSDALVHYGVQNQQRILPLPKPVPRPELRR